MQDNVAIIRETPAKIEMLRSKLNSLGKQELLDRKEQIKKLAREHRDDGTLENKDLEEKIAEVETLNEQIAEIVQQEKEIIDEIKAEEEKLATAQAEVKEENETRSKNYQRGENKNMENKEVNIRQAFAKYVLFESTHRADAKLSEMEKRALGVATTTTSESFVEATSGVDGINNGGIFIPHEVVLDILREEEVESPIYRDILTTSIKGLVKFPYRISKTGAKVKAELSPTENENVQWGILSGTTGNYTDSIVITFEAEAMAINEFTDYLISLIGESMRELLINDYIYGTGSDDHVKGITYQAIDGTYAAANADKYRQIIEDAIAKLPVKKRGGAKIYLAADIFDGITFEKDANGNYILPVLNGGGINRISTFPVEMDANLRAGDFIVGNISKYYKANINKELELGVDVSNQKRTKTYTTHMMVTAVPVPQSIVYGKKHA